MSSISCKNNMERMEHYEGKVQKFSIKWGGIYAVYMLTARF